MEKYKFGNKLKEHRCVLDYAATDVDCQEMFKYAPFGVVPIEEGTKKIQSQTRLGSN